MVSNIFFFTFMCKSKGTQNIVKNFEFGQKNPIHLKSTVEFNLRLIRFVEFDY